MKKHIQKFIFSSLGIENYLRFLQRSFFVMYNLKLLNKDKEYEYHYFAKNLIKEGDTVLDIGANLGYYSMLFSKWVKDSGKVYSVEPIALYNKIFKEKAKKRKNITLLPYALGKEEKKVILVCSPNVGYLRTGLPHVYDQERDGDMHSQEFSFDAEMKIPSKLFSSLGKLDYIKCDIEGFEYIVLSDMEDIIKKSKPIVQVEVWSENEQQITNLFYKLDYISYKLKNGILSPYKEGPEQSEHIPGDYIFIHKDNDIIKKLDLSRE